MSWRLSLDVQDPLAVPYFNWDVPVTNEEVRRVLREGSEEDRLTWMSRIMTEAHYPDVWAYLSLGRDVLPHWERLRSRLGRRGKFWEFLIGSWRRDGLV